MGRSIVIYELIWDAGSVVQWVTFSVAFVNFWGLLRTFTLVEYFLVFATSVEIL